ncbi:MAG: DUF262 domain-containing protein [Myxococcota bacterium]|jgi:hypothetical protein|nr:DUF262 domain-containing protein [Myxococcota bacterium]
MSTRTYYQQPKIVRIPILIDLVRNQEIRVARFQRPFVWTNEQRIDLFDSIEAGLPIGSLLVWRTRRHELQCYSSIGPFELGKRNADPAVSEYLLDGHQRVVTLYSALTAAAEQEPNWNLYFDLQQDIFVTDRDELVSQAPLHLFPLCELFEPERLFAFQRRLHDKNMPLASAWIKRLEALAANLKDYEIPIIPLVTEDLAQVTKTFQRINSRGTTMSEVHMVAALTWTEHFDINHRLDEERERLARVGWQSLDPQVQLTVVKLLAGLDPMKCSVDDVSQKLRETPSLLTHATEALIAAASFLRDCAQLYGPRALPYTWQLALLAEQYARHSEWRSDKQAKLFDGSQTFFEVRSALREWFFRTTFTEFFTSATSSVIRDARRCLKQLTALEQIAWGNRAKRPVRALTRFDYRAARAKAFTWTLASRELLHSDDGAFNGWEVLARHGNGAVMQLFSSSQVGALWSRSPANRLLLPPYDHQAFREAFQQGTLSGDVLDSHALGDETKPLAVLQARRLRLEQIEKKWVEELGLVWAGGEELNEAPPTGGEEPFDWSALEDEE